MHVTTFFMDAPCAANQRSCIAARACEAADDGTLFFGSIYSCGGGGGSLQTRASIGWSAEPCAQYLRAPKGQHGWTERASGGGGYGKSLCQPGQTQVLFGSSRAYTLWLGTAAWLVKPHKWECLKRLLRRSCFCGKIPAVIFAYFRLLVCLLLIGNLADNTLYLCSWKCEK